MRTLEEVRSEASSPPAPPAGPRKRGPYYVALAILAVIVVVTAAMVLTRDDEGGPSGSSDTTQQTVPTTTAPPTTAPPTTTPQEQENTAVGPLPGSESSTDVDADACGGFVSPRPQLASDEMEVKVYFACDAEGEDGRGFPVYRPAERSQGVLRASIQALLRGPTEAERNAGLASFFSDETALMLRSVAVSSDGHAVVDFGDFRQVVPNTSGSAGSAPLLPDLDMVRLFLLQIDETVFQFGSVESAEYRIEGSCETFTEWLQYGGCEPRTPGTSED